MSIVFISGSISIKKLPEQILSTISKIEMLNMDIIVGDACGVDKLVQEKLYHDNYLNVTVYTIYDTPRNILSPKFKIKKVMTYVSTTSEKRRQTYKDVAMATDCDYGLIIWDCKSSGSYNNILNLISQNKPFKVFSMKEGRFLTKGEKQLENIHNIYRQNNEYTISELFDEINRRDSSKSFKSINQLKNYLIEKKVLLLNEKNELVAAENYKGYVREESKRLKYSGKILNFLE